MSSWAMKWEYSFTSGIGVWFLVLSLLCRAAVPQVLMSSWCGFTLIIAPWCYSKALSLSSAKNYSLGFFDMSFQEMLRWTCFLLFIWDWGYSNADMIWLALHYCVLANSTQNDKAGLVLWAPQSVSSQKSWHPLWCFQSRPHFLSQHKIRAYSHFSV